jgi:hypothetical protein
MIPFKKGTFDALKDYLLSGSTLNNLYRGLRQRTPVAGQGIQLQEVDGGYIIHSTGGSGSGSGGGAFWGVFSATGGLTFQGGTVSGDGSGTVTVPDFLLVDGTSAPLGAEGDILYLIVSGYANSTGNALSGGCTVTAANLQVGLSTTNYPTYSSPSYNFGMEVGRWTSAGFAPAIRGNRYVTFYPGSGFKVSAG